jgi:hypothetical protein
MLAGCSSLTLLPDFSKWNIKNVEDIEGIFDNCISLSSFPNLSIKNINNCINNIKNI